MSNHHYSTRTVNVIIYAAFGVPWFLCLNINVCTQTPRRPFMTYIKIRLTTRPIEIFSNGFFVPFANG